MANIKIINPKTGKRVAELIKELNMTQIEFGEKIGLGSRQISCIVTGKRRLTEDNARRIAELFPPVRFEWLMGWDDYKTIKQLQHECIMEESKSILKSPLESAKHLYLVADVLRELGYSFEPLNWSDGNLLKFFSEHVRFLDKHEDEFLYFFTEDEIEKAYQRREQQICEESLHSFDSPSDDQCFDELSDWVVDNKDEFLNQMNFIASISNHLHEDMMNHEDKKFYIIDKKTNERYECTYAERERFIDQIYNILTLLVEGSIEQLKKQHYERQKNKITKKHYVVRKDKQPKRYKVHKKHYNSESIQEETDG